MTKPVITYLSLFAALYAALFLLSSPGWLDFGDRWGRAFYWNLAATQSQNHLYTQKLCCGYGKQTLGWYYMTTHLLSIERADWPKLHYMFKAPDANAWQREFQVGFPVEVSALNSLFVNIFHGVVARWKADAWSKQNMSCWSVNSFDFALEKLHSHRSARAIFCPRKSNSWINRPTRHVFLHERHGSSKHHRLDWFIPCVLQAINIKVPYCWSFVGNPSVTNGFPHKGPVMRKAF